MTWTTGEIGPTVPTWSSSSFPPAKCSLQKIEGRPWPRQHSTLPADQRGLCVGSENAANNFKPLGWPKIPHSRIVLTAVRIPGLGWLGVMGHDPFIVVFTSDVAIVHISQTKLQVFIFRQHFFTFFCCIHIQVFVNWRVSHALQAARGPLAASGTCLADGASVGVQGRPQTGAFNPIAKSRFYFFRNSNTRNHFLRDCASTPPPTAM